MALCISAKWQEISDKTSSEANQQFEQLDTSYTQTVHLQSKYLIWEQQER